jgi:SagB-type dehydrogenase family enzyme
MFAGRIAMSMKSFSAGRMLSIVLLIGAALALAQEPKLLNLPKPRTEGGRPLMEVLKDRKSSRAFSSKELPPQVLSNLLWAAFGVNRPESGKRTAPSAVNWQEIDIYVAIADGLYLFDAKGHALKLVIPEDIRALTGTQAFVREAPVDLVFVADFSKMGRAGDADKVFYSAADTGFISQNVYLYCASEGLATVVRGLVDRQTLAKKMGLRPDQKIILAQTVGYPKK